MKVLVIGGGGREHAIAYALNKSKRVSEIHAIPGNPGIAKIGTCHPGQVTDFELIKKIIKENQIDFTVIGPEDPLCLGLADELEAMGCPVFGPQKQAARLEGSKAFSKEFMVKHGIPTAAYKEVTTYESAIEALNDFNYPVVVKADGLAAGKGVIIAQNEEEAKEALKEIMCDKKLGDAGSKVVLEEFLTGFECSLLCFTDGKTILDPFMKGLKEDHMDYRGVVFIGLMIENKQAKVLEFNVRFGDPETQSILLRLDTDIMDIFEAVSKYQLDQVEVKWKKEHVACLVLASGGYPGSYEKGKVITGLDQIPDDLVIFHAGTAFNDQQEIVTNGGRVLNICALGSSLEDTRNKVYEGAKVIDFEGKYYRHDIGLI